MLFFLMKMDGRVNLQLLLLALVAASGFLPIAQGLLCHSCDSREGETYTPNRCGEKDTTFECNRENPYCYSERDNYGKGKVVHRFCDDGEYARKAFDCAFEVSPNGCFVRSIDNREKMVECKTRDFFNRAGLNKRDQEEGKGRSFENSLTLERCHCNTELCNGPSTAPTAGNGDDQVDDTTTEHGAIHSKSSIQGFSNGPILGVVVITVVIRFVRTNLDFV